MKNYKIINDEKELIEFIKWLPDLEENEKYFVSLFARKKYCTDLIKSNDKSQLKRFTSCKERLFDKIKQLECELGSYKLRDIEAPQESLVVYINPNPRNMKKATYHLMKKCVDLISNDNNGFNIHAEALSCIQRSKSKSYFCDFDIDDKSADLSKLNDILPKNCYDILETRGGYHVLVDTRKAPNTKWHMEITNSFDVDQVGDQLIPVVGCCQGGFTPKFINTPKNKCVKDKLIGINFKKQYSGFGEVTKEEEDFLINNDFICVVTPETVNNGSETDSISAQMLGIGLKNKLHYMSISQSSSKIYLKPTGSMPYNSANFEIYARPKNN